MIQSVSAALMGSALCRNHYSVLASLQHKTMTSFKSASVKQAEDCWLACVRFHVLACMYACKYVCMHVCVCACVRVWAFSAV
jgi:hypothetical protein